MVYIIIILWILSIIITYGITKTIYFKWVTEDYIKYIDKKCSNCIYKKKNGD